MRVYIVAPLLAAVVVTPLPAAAKPHAAPAALDRGRDPVATATAIADECAVRGFAVTRPSSTEVICQGQELDRRQAAFRPVGPAEDPRIKPQVYHRFAVEPHPAGALVRERSMIAWMLGGRLVETDPALASARSINIRLIEFYEALGFEALD